MTKKLVEINVADRFSTGNIMLNIAEISRRHGYETTTFSKMTRTSKKKNIKNHHLIGTVWENTLHRYISWITDFQDCGSYLGTKKLVRQLKRIDPDIIHIHDVVGWYLNIKVLFDYLYKSKKKVVWTFHCCWAYTGRCIYYDYVGCDEWKKGCKKCIQPEGYPTTKFFDHASWNYKRKKKLFNRIKEQLTIVTPSEWLKGEVEQSFLKEIPCLVINNGIDLSIFRERKSDFRKKYDLENKKVILGVSSAWGQPRKGLIYFDKLRKELDRTYEIVLVGANENDKAMIDNDIICIPKTENAIKLAEIYTASDVFVNPTLEDNFPTTNIEALACGTPVVTFKTGGSVEPVNSKTGMIVEQGNEEKLKEAIIKVANGDYKEECLKKSKEYDMNNKFEEYISLFDEIVKKQKDGV